MPLIILEDAIPYIDDSQFKKLSKSFELGYLGRETSLKRQKKYFTTIKDTEILSMNAVFSVVYNLRTSFDLAVFLTTNEENKKKVSITNWVVLEQVDSSRQNYITSVDDLL